MLTVTLVCKNELGITDGYVTGNVSSCYAKLSMRFEIAYVVDADQARRLLKEHPEINMRARNNREFQAACSDGNLALAQELWSLGKSSATFGQEPDLCPLAIDIHAHHDRALRSAYMNGKSSATFGKSSATFGKSSATSGHLKVAQWLWSLDQPGATHINLERALRAACRNGWLAMAQWIWSIRDASAPNHIPHGDAFRCACQYGHLELAQWLLSLEIGIDVHARSELAFRLACAHGHLPVVQWLWRREPLDLHAENEHAFRAACAHGHLEIAQWLWSIHRQQPSVSSRKIDLHACQEEAFRTACRRGDLRVAQWLWSLQQGIDVHALEEDAFRMACTHNREDVVRWLLSLEQEIDIHARQEQAFRRACHDPASRGICELLVEHTVGDPVRYIECCGNYCIVGAECTRYVHVFHGIPVSSIRKFWPGCIRELEQVLSTLMCRKKSARSAIC